ncbi:hypothetical protein AB0D11_35630 [Streptomyces monashensis]|uniref:hypothetical protein n=1 Tax=Streptomyces monashensis TaxID=1678012 RepID=UPI0033CCA7CB
MGAATVTLGLAGLGLSATSAQAATGGGADRSAGQPQSAFEDNAGQYKDFHAGQLDEGPGAPDESHPGAKFDQGMYKAVAGMDNQSFITLRDALLSQNPDAEPNPELRQKEKELQRSFYSNGCTGVPGSVLTQQETNACIQHDFRYTVGPNVYAGNPDAGKADKADADRQLGDNIGGVEGKGAQALTGAVGTIFYQPTPTAS